MQAPNIVLIVMDAVRAKNMSIYGYYNKTTPMIESLLTDCVLYENAICSSYWTLPSFASTFTGTHVSKHGLVIDGDTLNHKFLTLAEMLRTNGYVTLGICPNPYISTFSGLDRGFDVFFDPMHESKKSSMLNLFYDFFYRSSQDVAPALSNRRRKNGSETQERTQRNPSFQDQALQIFTDWRILKRISWVFRGLSDKYANYTNYVSQRLVRKVKEKPFFLFIHYNEAHTPYVLPRRFRGRFMDFGLEKKPWDVNEDYLKYYSGEARMSKSEFETLEAIYNGAISYLDTRIYEIYSFLDREELLDNTMLIITSDHGDHLGDHGLMFHVFSLYDALVKVPLIIKYPRDLGLSGTENRIVQNTDLFPTIMDLLGVNSRTLLDQIQGNSLLTSKIQNRSYSYAISELVKPFGPRMRLLKKRLKRYNRRLISIRTRDEKYISSSSGDDEFYNLKKDPDEVNNLIKSEEIDITKLRQRLTPWLESFQTFCDTLQSELNKKTRVQIEHEREIKQRLKQLGYL